MRVDTALVLLLATSAGLAQRPGAAQHTLQVEGRKLVEVLPDLAMLDPDLEYVAWDPAGVVLHGALTGRAGSLLPQLADAAGCGVLRLAPERWLIGPSAEAGTAGQRFLACLSDNERALFTILPLERLEAGDSVAFGQAAAQQLALLAAAARPQRQALRDQYLREHGLDPVQAEVRFALELELGNPRHFPVIAPYLAEMALSALAFDTAGAQPPARGPGAADDPVARLRERAPRAEHADAAPEALLRDALLPVPLRPQQLLTPLLLCRPQVWQYAGPAQAAGVSLGAGQPFAIAFDSLGGDLAVKAGGTTQELLDDLSLVTGRRWTPEQDAWEYGWLADNADLVSKCYAALPMADRLSMLIALRHGDARSLYEAAGVVLRTADPDADRGLTWLPSAALRYAAVSEAAGALERLQCLLRDQSLPTVWFVWFDATAAARSGADCNTVLTVDLGGGRLRTVREYLGDDDTVQRLTWYTPGVRRFARRVRNPPSPSTASAVQRVSAPAVTGSAEGEER